MKACTKCHIEKELTEFNKRSASPDGLAYRCRECNQATCEERNRAMGKQAMADIRAELPESRECRTCKKVTDRFSGRRRECNPCRELRRDKDRLAQYDRSPERRAKVYARNATRRAKVRKFYGEKDAINFVYFAAQVIEKEYGTKWHVDHTIPLNHEAVCGLHTPSNLTLLTQQQNLSKGNQL